MNEAGFSITFKLYNADADQMVTFRGEHPADWHDVMESAKTFIAAQHAKGWSLSRRVAPSALPQLDGILVKQQPPVPEDAMPPSPPMAPKSAPAATAGQGTSETGQFTADILSVEYTAKGERTGKLKGGQFAKYGVRLWPETAAALGFDLEQCEVGDHSINPLTVKYAIKDGKPSKVIGRAA